MRNVILLVSATLLFGCDNVGPADAENDEQSPADTIDTGSRNVYCPAPNEWKIGPQFEFVSWADLQPHYVNGSLGDFGNLSRAANRWCESKYSIPPSTDLNSTDPTGGAWGYETEYPQGSSAENWSLQDGLRVKCKRCNVELPARAIETDEMEVARTGLTWEREGTVRYKGVVRLSCEGDSGTNCLQNARKQCAQHLPMICIKDIPNNSPFMYAPSGNTTEQATRISGLISSIGPVNGMSPSLQSKADVDTLCENSLGQGWRVFTTNDAANRRIVDAYGNLGEDVERAWIHASGSQNFLNCWDQ